MVDRALKGRDVLSVPKVTLIIRDFVKLQEFPELLLERSFPMVFLLALDIGNYRRRGGLAYRECAISTLPVKPAELRPPDLNPFDELVFTVSATLATVNVRESPKNKWT